MKTELRIKAREHNLLVCTKCLKGIKPGSTITMNLNTGDVHHKGCE